jgi:hypothetical protein
MKKFITLVFSSFVASASLLLILNSILQWNFRRLDLYIFSIVGSLIGISGAHAIRYAVKLAKDHKV